MDLKLCILIENRSRLILNCATRCKDRYVVARNEVLVRIIFQVIAYREQIEFVRWEDQSIDVES